MFIMVYDVQDQYCLNSEKCELQIIMGSFIGLSCNAILHYLKGLIDNNFVTFKGTIEDNFLLWNVF